MFHILQKMLAVTYKNYTSTRFSLTPAKYSKIVVLYFNNVKFAQELFCALMFGRSVTDGKKPFLLDSTGNYREIDVSV
jgi:hypothetical protein